MNIKSQYQKGFQDGRNCIIAGRYKVMVERIDGKNLPSDYVSGFRASARLIKKREKGIDVSISNP